MDTRKLKKLLAEAGVNLDHVFRVYNDKNKDHRRFKIMFAVFGGAITGEDPIDSELAEKVSALLQQNNFYDVKIYRDEVQSARQLVCRYKL